MNDKLKSQTIKVFHFSVFLKIIIGIILISFVSYALLIFIWLITSIFNNNFLMSDSLLYFLFICFTISSFVSFAYFSSQKFQRKLLITTHSLGAILFLVFFIFQFINVRTNQKLVLNTYQQFGHAVKQGNFEYAYQLMSPDFRQLNTVDDLANDDYFLEKALTEINTIYAVEYSFWDNDAYITVDPYSSSSLTFWRRPMGGVALNFEYIDEQWLFTGDTMVYILD